MKADCTLLVSNIPAMFFASLAVVLILNDQSPWVWVWFLILAAVVSVTPKGDAA